MVASARLDPNVQSFNSLNLPVCPNGCFCAASAAMQPEFINVSVASEAMSHLSVIRANMFCVQR
jgi:hypothetical protein